jgi:hypothetical protein
MTREEIKRFGDRVGEHRWSVQLSQGGLVIYRTHHPSEADATCVYRLVVETLSSLSDVSQPQTVTLLDGDTVVESETL